MFSPIIQIGFAFAAIVFTMIVLWFVQRRTGNAGIVDVAWAGSIGFAGVFYAVTGCGDDLSRLLCAILATGWSARLTVYLFRRVVGHPEEGRYAALRQKWAGRVQQKMFGFYLLQAAAATFFSLPFLVLASRTQVGLSVVDIGGLTVWLVAIIGIAVADRQLNRFRSNPDNRGKTCRVGLWRYSRHPNYFFEWLHWCSYVPLVFGSSGWWAAALVPLVLLYFLFFVTGIPPTEAQALASRGDDYRRYQNTTSVFIPWFPKQDFNS